MILRHRFRRRNEVSDSSSSDQTARAVSCSESEGLLELVEPELFRSSHASYCRRLAEASARRPDVRSVQIRLDTGTCRLSFVPGKASARVMADQFAAAVRDAANPDSDRDPEPTRHEPERDWTELTVFATDRFGSAWETTRHDFDAIRLSNPVVRKDSTLAHRVARELLEVHGISGCRATLWKRDLEVRFDPALTSAEFVVLAAENVFQRTLHTELDRLSASTHTPVRETFVATGLRRVWYLSLAGGSFILTLVGLVIPGVPTVPFLMATSYYLVRSSPWLNGLLLRSRFFGPILADIETWGGLRRINKFKLIGLVLVLGGVTLIIVGPPLALLLVMGVMSTVSIYAISRLPSLPPRIESQRSLPLAVVE